MIYTRDTMPEQRMQFLRACNADPTNRTLQLVFADYLAESDDPWESFWRVGRGGRGALVGRGGRGGLVGRVALVGRGGLIGRVGLVGHGSLGGRGGRGGRGGLVGRGGRIGFHHLEAPIVLIPGERVMVFLPNGYGFSVLVGDVAVELPHGWIVDPCREVLNTNNGDNWTELAKGKNKTARGRCEFGQLIDGGFRVPQGCGSMIWHGELPEGP